MRLSLLKGKYAICRLEKSAPIPEWLKESTFFSVSKTFEELSFVCSQESIPESIDSRTQRQALVDYFG